MSPRFYSKDEVDSLQADAKAYIMQRWEPRPGHEPPVITHGEGVYFWDVSGKRYLDLISQLYNVHIGLGNREIVEAAKRQLDEMAYASPSYFNVPQIQLAKRLAQITPGDLCKTDRKSVV